MSYLGKLVEYIDNDRFVCAFVLADQGKRVHVLTQHGRDMNLPLSRIVHASTKTCPLQAGRDEMLKRLNATAEARAGLMPSVNLNEIWELAAESQEERFTPQFLAELCFGNDSGDDQVASFLRCIFEDRLYFKYKENIIIAHPAEVVNQKKEALDKERQYESLLNEGAKALSQLAAAGTDPGAWANREACLRLVADYYLHGNDAPESAVARELLKRAQLTKPHDAYHVLIKAGLWRENENIALLRQEIPVAFEEEALVMTRTISLNPPAPLATRRRRDFEALPLLTIDGAGTRDFDDALHVEQHPEHYVVGIHISDVAALIRPGDPLFQEATRRGTTLYFPDATVPMLPQSISEGVCSLIKDQTRAAMSFMVKLSEAGEILDYDVMPSLVRVHRQLTYSAVDQMMATDPELDLLHTLAQRLRQNRLNAGACLLPIPDVNISFEPNGQILIQKSDVDTPSRVLVSEFMVLANALGAQYLVDRGVPGLFRCQDEPQKRLLFGLEKDLFLNFRQRRFLAAMELSTSAKSHACVGVPAYTTVTSPIRRFLDLVVQHQIFSLLDGKGARFSEDDLRGIAKNLTDTLARANNVRQLRHRYWILKYLEGKMDSRLDALVLEKSPHRILVVLLDCLLFAEMPPTNSVRIEPGQTISVRLEKADALDNILKIGF